MFRGYDPRFLIPYVILLLALTGLVVWYEVAYRTVESWPDTIKAIGNGVSSAVSATFATFATVEGTAYMVLALMRWRKLKEEDEEKLELLRSEAREEGLKQGIEQGREQGLEQGREQGLEQGREQGLEQGREQGLEQGREEERRRWEDWWQRQAEEFRRAGLSYDDPPPPEQNGTASDHSTEDPL